MRSPSPFGGGTSLEAVMLPDGGTGGTITASAALRALLRCPEPPPTRDHTPSEVGDAMGKIMAILVVGITTGPVVGNLLAIMGGAAAPGWAAAGFSFVLAVTTTVRFEDTGVLIKPLDKSKGEYPAGEKSLTPSLLAMMLISDFCRTFATLGQESIVPLFAFDYYALDGVTNAPIYLVYAFSAFIGTILTTELQKKMSLQTLAFISGGCSLAAVGQVNFFNLTTGVPLLFQFYPMQFIATCGLASHSVVMQVAMTKLTPKHQQAKVQSATGMVLQFGRAVGPLIGSAAYTVGNQLADNAGGNCSFIIAGVGVVLGVGINLVLYKNIFIM